MSVIGFRAMAAKRKRRPGASGPSGRNTLPGKILHASEEQWARWTAAALKLGVSMSEWMRRAADEKAQRQ